MDVMITLLSLGSSGYKRLLKERKELFEYMSISMKQLAAKYGEKVLETKNNPISLGMTLSFPSEESSVEATEIGSMLFTRCVSGTRVVAPGKTNQVSGYTFQNFGAHSNQYPFAYLTASAAIGMTKEDVDLFISRLTKVFAKNKPNSINSTGNNGNTITAKESKEIHQQKKTDEISSTHQDRSDIK